jgi:pSer/pThr/pTyr-binding forkhead associated (FHA) protein
MASLFVIAGTDEGDYYPLGRRTNVIGRDEALPIQIIDEHVSRKHMQIRYEKSDQLYYALDMKSKHGVFINGRKIDDETALNNSDQIRIGATTLLFTLEDFSDQESALSHYKKVGERVRNTLID